MSVRELVVLGTASQARTRTRNGYLLRWDGEGLLFDPAREPSGSSCWRACRAARSPASA